MALAVGLAGFAWAPFWGCGQGVVEGVMLGLSLALLLAPGLRAGARLVVLAGSSTMVAAAIVPPIWPLTQLVVGGPAVALALLFPSWSLPSPWLARGRLRWGLVVCFALLAAVALASWALGTSPDLRSMFAMVPRLPWPALVLAAAGFSVVNAILEELTFRGLLQGAFESTLGPGAAPLVLQGVAFGLLHWHGFPSGWLGALMAGSWGIMLGWVRRRSGGLLTPILAHIVADAVIFTLLVVLNPMM